MKQLSHLVKKVSSILDRLAGLCFFSVMLLIVANIVLRTVFNQPILGTYELVGFLTGMGVALALAHCAFQDGHIAVSFIMERLPRKTQSIAAVLVNTASSILWAAAAWSLGKFGQTMKIKGLVSPSAEIPVYPFIYLVAFGLVGLCLVLLFKSLVSFREVLGIDTAKKVTR
ncbi:TRAP transporter small permease [Desulfosporosinus lacus]|uniref:TRAP-type C4-dicarboxylate transport system, small permease component n=1 Tax=Desulfosporosinus lacus DSM 15449 TaxID=1121420 RepID=A0A1M6A6V6_9FIRM|nr:TRAP transporter small permease [Desulfosporosinus lacus]SHI32234.1 TRAP-type C4-dicarboxylate transport system, small permease component [Desulfosporosinus lacus DSM 15449]